MMKLKQLVLGVAGAALLAAAAPQAATAQLWYNGEFDGANGLLSMSSPSVNATTYDNFVVSGTGWTITSVFGDFLTDFVWTTADYEIRSGVSEGNAGTLLFSGNGIAASQTATGRSGFGYDEYRAEISGLSFFLGAGTYWLAIRPITGGDGLSYVSTTGGLNGVNSNIDGTTAFTRDIEGKFFSDDYIVDADFAYGVGGSAGDDVVPEPATMTLLATGLAGMAASRRRKKIKA